MAEESVTAWHRASSGPVVETARKTGVFFRSPQRRWIAVTGPDAASHLQAMCTQDLGGQRSGEARFSALADDRGRYLADFWVIRVGDDWRLDAGVHVAGSVVKRLNLFAVSSDARLSDMEGSHVLYHLEGPLAGAVLASWIGIRDSSAAAGRVSWRGEIVEHCRRSHFGEPGFTLLAPRSCEEEFGVELSTVCREHGVLEAGEAEEESLRVQAGRPLGGVDMGEADLLQETGLVTAVSLTKGCYPGQEILQRIARQGKVRKLLTGFRVRKAGSAGPLAGRSAITAGDDEVGHVTSDTAAGGDRLALGWIAATALRENHQIVTGGREFGAEIVELPFITGSLGRLPEVPQELKKGPIHS